MLSAEPGLVLHPNHVQNMGKAAYSTLNESLYVRTMQAVLVQEARTYVFNLRRACAARVTVVVLCVCLPVSLSTTIFALQATRRLMSDTNSFSATRARKTMC